MPRSVRARLDDIRDALAGMRETLDGVPFERFEVTWQLRSAV